jgi:hypothetical protein
MGYLRGVYILSGIFSTRRRTDVVDGARSQTAVSRRYRVSCGVSFMIQDLVGNPHEESTSGSLLPIPSLLQWPYRSEPGSKQMTPPLERLCCLTLQVRKNITALAHLDAEEGGSSNRGHYASKAKVVLARLIQRGSARLMIPPGNFTFSFSLGDA